MVRISVHIEICNRAKDEPTRTAFPTAYHTRLAALQSAHFQLVDLLEHGDFLPYYSKGESSLPGMAYSTYGTHARLPSSALHPSNSLATS